MFYVFFNEVILIMHHLKETAIERYLQFCAHLSRFRHIKQDLCICSLDVQRKGCSQVFSYLHPDPAFSALSSLLSFSVQQALLSGRGEQYVSNDLHTETQREI